MIQRGDKQTIIGSCLKMWEHWDCVRQLSLVENMRVAMCNDREEDAFAFGDYLLRVGNGTEVCVPHPYYTDCVRLPSCMVVKDVDEMICRVFPSLSETGGYEHSCILAPRNEHCDDINARVCW